MPDALIAVLVVLAAAVVFALPRGGSVPASRHGRVRRRQVLTAVAAATGVSLWPALTWHGQWWVGPSAGLALLSAYLFAMRPRRRSPDSPPPRAPRDPEGPGARAGEEPLPLRATPPYTR